MLTDRDIELLKFINRYGKTYYQVLGKTFFTSEQVARNRINKLAKNNFFGFWDTGLSSPKTAIVLGRESKSYLLDNGTDDIKKVKLNSTTINHNIIEQIADYHLQKLGTVERTTVFHQHGKLNHVPDFIYIDEKSRKFYIEIETTIKTTQRYDNIIQKILNDKPYAIIYITEKADKIKTLANKMPHSDKLFFIDIENLIKNISETNRISPKSQKDVLGL